MPGFTSNHSSQLLQRLVEQFPEVATVCGNFKFQGRGQRDTPVTDAKGIVTIIMIMPGSAAATVRQSASAILVRYLGGDLSLVEEVMQNHEFQADIDPDHPAAIFG